MICTLSTEILCPLALSIGVVAVGLKMRKFRKEIEEEIRQDPTQPFPSVHLEVRSRFTRKLPLDAKNLFLSEIPPYDTL